MDWKADRPLASWQHSNPVMHEERVDLDALGVPEPTAHDLDRIFVALQGKKLQTWNRSVDEAGHTILRNDPHWLGVRRGTPMHTDPKYPRYSHQLKVRVDQNIFVRGLDGTEMQLVRGTFYILDTHSPHQVFHKDAEGAWNVTASIDHDHILNPETALARLIEYARTTPITAGVAL